MTAPPLVGCVVWSLTPELFAEEVCFYDIYSWGTLEPWSTMDFLMLLIKVMDSYLPGFFGETVGNCAYESP